MRREFTIVQKVLIVGKNDAVLTLSGCVYRLVVAYRLSRLANIFRVPPQLSDHAGGLDSKTLINKEAPLPAELLCESSGLSLVNLKLKPRHCKLVRLTS